MLNSERSGLVGNVTARQNSAAAPAATEDNSSYNTSTLEKKLSTKRGGGITMDWHIVPPSTILANDSAPAMNDRYSETSSFDAGRSVHPDYYTINMHNGSKTSSKLTYSDLETKGANVITDKADTQAMFVQVNPKKRNMFQLFKKSHPRLLSHRSVIVEHESQVRRTKKIIEAFMKSGKEVFFGPKAENLRGVFKRILTIIRVSQIFKRSHSIGAEQHRLIRDLSSHRYDMEYYSRVRRLSWLKIKAKFWQCIEAMLRCGAPRDHVLLPTALANVYLTAFQLIFNAFALFYASIFIVFDFRNRLLEIENGVLPVSEIYTFNVFILVFTSTIDILKGFNTAFYRKGETITDRYSIALNYLGGRFIFDVLALFSVVMNRTFFPKVSPLLIYRFQFLFFFKIHLVIQLITFFKTTFIQKEKYDNLIQLIRLLLILCFVSHINAILYHTQAQLQIYFLDQQNTWLTQAQLIDASYWTRYIFSFYCAVGTLVTAIIYNPLSTLETAFMSLSLLINCCIFGYLINELGNIMGNIERASKKSKKELRLINTFLQTKNVNLELQTRIRNYLEYMHIEEKQLNLEETKEVIDKLSSQLKQELMKEVNSQYIRLFELLNRKFSPKIQDKSLFLMRDHKYTPGEIIFKEGQEDDSSIFLVWEGKVEIFHTNQRQEDYVVHTIGPGQSFGEISFFTGALRSASARSSEFTSLIQISRKDFMHLLKEHSQEDYEIFQQINHTIQHSRDYSLLSNQTSKLGKCYTCGSMKHMASTCSLTHFAPLQVAVVLTSQRMQHKNRVKRKRWSGERFRPVNQNNLYRIESAAIKIEENYEKLVEDLGEFFGGDMSDQELEDLSDGLPQPQVYTNQQNFLQQQQQQQHNFNQTLQTQQQQQAVQRENTLQVHGGSFDRSMSNAATFTDSNNTTQNNNHHPATTNNNNFPNNTANNNNNNATSTFTNDPLMSNFRQFQYQKASIHMPPHQVSFATPTNNNNSEGTITQQQQQSIPHSNFSRFESIRDPLTAAGTPQVNWGILRRFDSSHMNFQSTQLGQQQQQQLQQQQQQQQNQLVLTSSPSLLGSGMKGEIRGSSSGSGGAGEKKSIIKQNTITLNLPMQQVIASSSQLQPKSISISHSSNNNNEESFNSDPVIAAAAVPNTTVPAFQINTSTLPQNHVNFFDNIGGGGGGGGVVISPVATPTDAATTATNKLASSMRIKSAAKTVQALFKFNTVKHAMMRRKSFVEQPASHAHPIINIPGVRPSYSQRFSIREMTTIGSNLQQQHLMQQQQQQLQQQQQEENLNPNLPHPILQALLEERAEFHSRQQQTVMQQQSAMQVNRFGDPYADLIEFFCGKVSMRIDFMRNYSKYFTKFNIEEIEKTLIGKHNEFNLKKINSLQMKKVASFKKQSQLFKAKFKKHEHNFVNRNRNNQSIGMLPPLTA